MSQPKVAFFDIETAPSLGYFWGKLWETDIIGVHEPWYMLSFAYKWMGSDRIHFHGLPDYPLFKRDKMDDRMLLKDLHTMLDAADVVIAHNGDRFDFRKTNARFIMQGLLPPKPFKTIDTLKQARKYFNFDSNRLNDLGQYLKVGKKIPHTGFDLWKRAMEGDKSAWRTMREYNMHDVELLERVYEKLKPYMATHPDLRAYDGAPGCPTCRSTHVTKQGFKITRKRKYQQFKCQDCGSWFDGGIIKTPK